MSDPAKELVNYLRSQGIHDEDVLATMAKIPRELFVDEAYKTSAYIDQPLPIACGQTISQPYIVALMTQEVRQEKKLNKVLEVGTGSGYQAAVLSHLAHSVYSIERIQTLFENAKKHLAHYPNVYLKFDDGNEGWIEHAPYDGIIVTAAAPSVPAALKTQLAEGGRLVIPVNSGYFQVLKLITRQGDSYSEKELAPVLFVPMLGGIEMTK